MSPLPVVLDTNVLVSALIFRSKALAWLRPAWRARKLVSLVSEDTISELVEVLQYSKFRLADSESKELLVDYLPWCEMIVVSDPPAIPNCRDPKDRPFLELALFAQADALVTGDDDLLALKPVFSIPIITPNELRSRLTGVG